MANQSAAVPTRKLHGTKKRRATSTFGIVEDHAGRSPWQQLRGGIGSVIKIGGNALGSVYAAVAQVVVERAEELEDRHAERRVRRRGAAKQARRVSSAPNAGLLESRATSSSKKSI